MGTTDFTQRNTGIDLLRALTMLVMGVFITNSEARLSEDVPYSIGIYWILMVTAFFLIWNQYPPNPGKTRKKLYVLFQWLGAIGWTYLLCALIYVFTRDNLKYLIPVWMGQRDSSSVAFPQFLSPDAVHPSHRERSLAGKLRLKIKI